ncbi:MAG: Holliday junction branch migration DNA helicase RuvB [bacterium]
MLNNDNQQLNVLRPTSFDDFIGRVPEKKLLKMMIDSAKVRDDNLEHLLLYGPPGLGKTTLAMIVANEMGTNLCITAAPSINSKSDLASILMNLSQGDILFIDEIHRLNTTIEEFLYPVMEDFMMDITMGKGLTASVVRVPLKKFTLIGATTKISNISAPLRDRFGGLIHLDYYTDDEIEQIISRSAQILNLTIDNAIIQSIAQRSRGTARIANKILKIIRDYITVHTIEKLIISELDGIFDEIGIDDEGLESMDRKILETIYVKFDSKPVSLSTLVAAISEDKRTVEEYYEPHLIKKGFIQKTSKGRIITDLGIKHIKKHLK